MPIGSKRCRPTNTTARWPRPSRLSANSISPNSRAWRPHAASDATDLPATNAQDKPTSRSERFPDAWPHHRRYPARGSPPGAHKYPPRYAPPAARRARRYARVPPMDSGDEPLPMIKKDHADWGAFSAPIDNFNLSLGVDYFWTPIMAYFSAPIDMSLTKFASSSGNDTFMVMSRDSSKLIQRAKRSPPPRRVLRLSAGRWSDHSAPSSNSAVSRACRGEEKGLTTVTPA